MERDAQRPAVAVSSTTHHTFAVRFLRQLQTILKYAFVDLQHPQTVKMSTLTSSRFIFSRSVLVICVNVYRMLFSIVAVVFAVLNYNRMLFSIEPVVFAVLNYNRMLFSIVPVYGIGSIQYCKVFAVVN